MNDMTLRSAFRLKMKELEAYEQGIQISMNQYGVEIGDYLSSTVVPQGYTCLLYTSRCVQETVVPLHVLEQHR